MDRLLAKMAKYASSLPGFRQATCILGKRRVWDSVLFNRYAAGGESARTSSVACGCRRYLSGGGGICAVASLLCTSLGLREQSKSGRDYVSFCIAAYLLESKLSAATRLRKSAAQCAAPLIALYSAEAEGFEPPERCRSTVFKTAAIDHSATPPDWNCKISKNI